MEWERRDRRAIGKAIRKALKTGSGSCVLLDGTMIIVTRDKAGATAKAVFNSIFPNGIR
jgi:hypothetical protein